MKEFIVLLFTAIYQSNLFTKSIRSEINILVMCKLKKGVKKALTFLVIVAVQASAVIINKLSMRFSQRVTAPTG